MRACDQGAPTIRKRLFLIARSDGHHIVWPRPTHAPKALAAKTGLKPYRTAADCIDWSIECPSIYGRARPLQDNTLRRIARGLMRYVIMADEPFIVNLTHAGRIEPAMEPLRTTTCAKRGEKAIVKPYLAGVGGRAGQSPERPVDAPYHTTTAKADTAIVTPYVVGAGGSEYAGKPRPGDAPFNAMTTHNRSAIIAPSLIEIGYGERPGQEPRVPGLDKPLGTVVSGGRKHAVIAAHLAQHNNHRGVEPSHGRPVDSPISTLTGKGSQQQVVAAYMAQHNTEKGDGVRAGRAADAPLSTITTAGKQQQLTTAFMTKLRGTNVGDAADAPLHTLSAGGTHHAETRAFLVKYYGNEKDGAGLTNPMGTVTTKDRFGLVKVEMTVPPHLTDEQRYNAWWTVRLLEKFGEIEDRSPVPAPRASFVMVGDYIIVDIGMRMLVPRELYKAQGFPDDYIIDRTADGRPLTKTAQVRMCGNSVCPPLSQALAAANVPESSLIRKTA